MEAGYNELIRQAAQGEVLHNDDTTVKILEAMGKRAERHDPAEDAPQRRGRFSTGKTHCSTRPSTAPTSGTSS